MHCPARLFLHERKMMGTRSGLGLARTRDLLDLMSPLRTSESFPSIPDPMQIIGFQVFRKSWIFNMQEPWKKMRCSVGSLLSKRPSQPLRVPARYRKKQDLDSKPPNPSTQRWSGEPLDPSAEQKLQATAGRTSPNKPFYTFSRHKETLNKPFFRIDRVSLTSLWSWRRSRSSRMILQHRHFLPKHLLNQGQRLSGFIYSSQ